MIGKVWAWWKAHWQWVLFPVGLGSLLIAYLVGRSSHGRISQGLLDLSPNGLPEVDRVLHALKRRDQKLAELSEEHKEKLADLSEEQQDELRQLREQPLTEVVAWFDKLR